MGLKRKLMGSKTLKNNVNKYQKKFLYRHGHPDIPENNFESLLNSYACGTAPRGRLTFKDFFS